MMEEERDRSLAMFWWGFGLAVVAAALYWLWRQNREVVPGPLIIDRSSGPDFKAADTTVSSVPAVTETDEPMADDLTQIRGIGPVFARRLHEAGIVNFAQLAVQEPERVRGIAGIRGAQGDPSEWIAEAAKLAG